MGGGVDLIKGHMAVDLMNFGNFIGFISAKGYLKNLSKSDVEPLLDITVSILEAALKEPSFSKEEPLILWELGSARTFKDTILRPSTKVIKGDDKKVILEKALYWYKLVINLFGNCLFSTLSEDSVLKMFPKAMTEEIDLESREDIQDGIWCVIYSLPTPAAMILFRVAERELRRYVKKITGESINGWTGNVKKLAESNIADRSITKEFDWLKEKRNEAQHPDKRYTQDEAEEILHRLSGLLKAIYGKKEER